MTNKLFVYVFSSRRYFLLRSEIGILLVLLFGACRGPLHKGYNPKTYKEDLREIEKNKLVSGYKAQLIEAYIYDAENSKSRVGLQGMRYSDILRLAERREKLYNDRLFPLRELASVDVREKDFYAPVSGKSFITLQSRIISHSDRLITSIHGELRIRSKSGKLIKTTPLHFNDSLPPGEEVSHMMYTLYFEYNLSDSRLRGTPLQKLRISWHPKYIRFANGEELRP